MSPTERESSSSTSSPAAGEPFVLEYSVESGRPLGTGVRKISSRLIIQSERRMAFLEKHRSQSDRAGEPIGTFRDELPESLLARVLDRAIKTVVPEPPSARGGGPGSTVITLRFEQGARKVERIFNTGDMAILAVMADLLTELDQIGDQLSSHPVCALKASVEYKSGPTPGFVLTLTNIGKERICFADPRYLPSDDPDCWAGANVAQLPEEKPGVTSPPLKWTRVPLERPIERSAGAAADSIVVLKPGESFSAHTITWQDKRPGTRYLAIGVYSDYTGPSEIDKIYRVRGATFSDGLEFE